MVYVAGRVVGVDLHSVTEHVGGVLRYGNADEVLVGALRSVEIAERKSVLVHLVLKSGPLRGPDVEEFVVLVRQLFFVRNHERLVVRPVEPERLVFVGVVDHLIKKVYCVACVEVRVADDLRDLVAGVVKLHHRVEKGHQRVFVDHVVGQVYRDEVDSRRDEQFDVLADDPFVGRFVVAVKGLVEVVHAARGGRSRLVEGVPELVGLGAEQLRGVEPVALLRKFEPDEIEQSDVAVLPVAFNCVDFSAEIVGSRDRHNRFLR